MAAKKQTYEENIEQIDEILEKLENEELSLDDSIEEYEKAIKLIKDSEKLLEIGEGKTYQYQKTYVSERFYNYLSSSADFVKFAGKSIRKALIQKIELKGNLANPKIWIYILGYKNPIEIGPELRVSRSDIGMFDTFEYLKKIFNH